MAALVWFTSARALALHGLVPDRFWGGIVGAFLGAGGRDGHRRDRADRDRPGIGDTDLATVLFAVPGTLLGLAIYAIGVRAERTPSST